METQITGYDKPNVNLLLETLNHQEPDRLPEKTTSRC